ncbi:PEP-CTERM sorting domain-containing protein [Bowmanella dokdonensis]|uniref:PEP-CTERM sorting domain-containing protein n=1 Tax=Bowmanella dokdonensis TaxID=751969 RepID=A0A939DMV7_9ALTE|nr:PEP-CTERM sorting domain-containing protein [Bowmanella dokdonensis]MBN7825694.1 PEP-CTERM sorting domain-containing protein [Bowmanella dokdonensis]
MNLVRNLLLSISFFFSLSASASIIFTFEINELPEFNNNVTIGDSLTFAFSDDSNFDAGLSWHNIESVSYDTVSLGSFVIDSFDYSYSDYLISQFFSFTNLGKGGWQLDILVGRTGMDAAIVFEKGQDQLQFGQTVDGGGSTNLFIQSSSDFIFLHDFSNSFKFSATSTPVPEPSSFAIFGLSLLSLCFKRKLISPQKQ